MWIYFVIKVKKKGGKSCHEETEQVLPDKDQEQEKERVWEEAVAEGAKWAATNPVQAPTEETLIRAYQILSADNENVEYLIGYEGNAFAFTGNVQKDLLSITSVHPMREEAVAEFLNKAGADWSVVQRLIDTSVLVKKEYQGKYFYARKLFAPRDKKILGLRME